MPTVAMLSADIVWCKVQVATVWAFRKISWFGSCSIERVCLEPTKSVG